MILFQGYFAFQTYEGHKCEDWLQCYFFINILITNGHCKRQSSYLGHCKMDFIFQSFTDVLSAKFNRRCSTSTI